MVVLVILFPAMVMHYKRGVSTMDLDKVKIEIPQITWRRLISANRPKNSD